MQFKEIKTNKGTLKYRMPLADEVYDVIAWYNIEKPDDMTQTQKVLKMKQGLIKNMAPLIDCSALDGVSNYDEVRSDPKTFTMALGDIADEVLGFVGEVFQKKDSSPMQSTSRKAR